MSSLQTDISILTEEQLPEIMVLQEKVIAVLEKPEFLQPLTEDEFLNILRGNGMMAGAFVDGQLIAFRAMLDPGDDAEHLGSDIGVPADQLKSVLYSEVSCVDPTYRGNGLQMQLGNWLMARVDTDRYRYICSTVAPMNIPSLKDKFALGLQIAALKIKYGGKLRYVLFRDLQSSVSADNPAASTAVLMSSIEEQQDLLALGWTGTKMERRGDDWYARYVK